MAIKRKAIHWLLVLCIGLLPALNAGAMSHEHAPAAPLDCVDCDPAGSHHDKSCQERSCASITQHCQANSGLGCLPVVTAFPDASPRQTGNPGRTDALEPQDITESIYRPPIT